MTSKHDQLVAELRAALKGTDSASPRPKKVVLTMEDVPGDPDRLLRALMVGLP